MSEPIEHYLGKEVTVVLKIRERYSELKHPKHYEIEFSGVLESTDISGWYKSGNVFFPESIISHIGECT